MIEIVPAIRECFGDIRPGDVFAANDPYAGGSTHLPDITVAAAIFQGDELAGFAVTVAHHAEVGGSRLRATDVFDEGLRIPPVRILREGVVQDDLMRLILANCRVPGERQGDLRAQIAAVRLAGRRYAELSDKHGAGTVHDAAGEWLRKAERQALAALEAYPHGTYRFTDYMDDDGVGGSDLAICASVTIAPAGMRVDFSGSSPQVAGSINVVRSALLATVYYTAKLVLDPTLPANSGYFRLIDVEAPEGSLVQSSEPAPVLARSDTCQRIVDVLLGAFAQATPERVVAACNGAITGIEFNGRSAESGEFSYIETLGGGFGARPTSDGPDAVQAHMTNTSNLPIEVLESEFPLMVRRYALREGSGGDGEFRGGLGIVREIELRAPTAYYRSKGDRTRRGPWGLQGGGAGACTEFVLNPGTLQERTLGTKESIVLEQGDVVRISTPGGGGYGDPGHRTAQRRELDVLAGKAR
jgi:N-methylhydantoinase B